MIQVDSIGEGADSIVVNVTALDATGSYFGTMTVTLTSNAKAIAMNSVGTRTYVATMASAIKVIQTSTNSIVDTINLLTVTAYVPVGGMVVALDLLKL